MQFQLKTLFLIFLCVGCSSNPIPRQKNQILFVAFDAIPYSLVERLYEEGKLSSFQKPSKLIAAFPSTTTACFTGIFRPLGAEKAPGYDAKFFSYAQRKVEGDLLEAYDIGGKGYKRFFSYMRSTGFEQVVMYTMPFFALRVDLTYLKPAIWNAPEKRAIFFYIGSSDSTAHLDGKGATEKLFLDGVLAIEQLRREYQKDFGRDLKVVLFSDHGFHWDQMKPIDVLELGRRLEKEGLQLEDDLKKPNHVAAITWGNISGGDLYTAPQNIPTVSSVLLKMPGVDLVFFRNENKIIIQARRENLEEARMEYDDSGEKFRYQPVQGDPLGYDPVVKELKRVGKLNQKGFALEKDWFEATKDHHYPDAPYRIWDAFFGLSFNPATILLSTQEDFEFGDNLTRFGAKIRGGLLGTHGALAQDSSAAFILTDIGSPLPRVVRYDEALKHF